MCITVTGRKCTTPGHSPWATLGATSGSYIHNTAKDWSLSFHVNRNHLKASRTHTVELAAVDGSLTHQEAQRG